MNDKIEIPDWKLILIGIFFSLFSYAPLINSYFAHDEWTSFFKYYELNKLSIWEALKWFFIPHAGQFAPLSESVSYLIFRFFGLNYTPYFFVGLLLHGVVGILLIIFLAKLTKSKFLSLFLGCIFIIAPHHFQATSWVIANIGYSLSAIFLVLSLIFFFEWIKSYKTKFGVLVSFFLVFSLLAKEITMFSFIALPIIAFIFTKNFKKVISTIIMVTPVFLFVVWHYLFTKSHPALDYSTSSLPSFVNVLNLPMRALSESFLPQHFIYLISKLLLSLLPPYNLEKFQTTQFNQNVETNGAEFVVVMITAGAVALSWYLYKKFYKGKNKNVFLIYLAGLILTALSGLPYVFVDSSGFTLLQPRYVYIGVMTLSISLVPLLQMLFKRFPGAMKIGLSCLVLLLFVSTFLMSKVNADTNVERKNILLTIGNSVKDGSQNTIIYTKSDSSFYGMPDTVKILPFQAGAGKVIAAYLHDKVHLPEKLYESQTLGALDSQGFYSDEKGSFGYFRDLELLKGEIKKNKIKTENIYAFEYSSKTKSITKITSSFLQ